MNIFVRSNARRERWKQMLRTKPTEEEERSNMASEIFYVRTFYGALRSSPIRRRMSYARPYVHTLRRMKAKKRENVFQGWSKPEAGAFREQSFYVYICM